MARLDAYDSKSPYVFISYSHKDQKEVFEVLEKMKNEHKINFWCDEELHAGLEWYKEAKDVIDDEKCICVVFFGSESALQSEACLRELREAREKYKRILPVNFTSELFSKQLADIISAEGNKSEIAKKTIEGYLNDDLTFIVFKSDNFYSEIKRTIEYLKSTPVDTSKPVDSSRWLDNYFKWLIDEFSYQQLLIDIKKDEKEGIIDNVYNALSLCEEITTNEVYDLLVVLLCETYKLKNADRFFIDSLYPEVKIYDKQANVLLSNTEFLGMFGILCHEEYETYQFIASVYSVFAKVNASLPDVLNKEDVSVQEVKNILNIYGINDDSFVMKLNNGESLILPIEADEDLDVMFVYQTAYVIVKRVWELWKPTESKDIMHFLINGSAAYYIADDDEDFAPPVFDMRDVISELFYEISAHYGRLYNVHSYDEFVKISGLNYNEPAENVTIAEDSIESVIDIFGYFKPETKRLYNDLGMQTFFEHYGLDNFSYSYDMFPNCKDASGKIEGDFYLDEFLESAPYDYESDFNEKFYALINKMYKKFILL